MRTHYDALICGGGLAGLTLARQLCQGHPDMVIGVVEKTTRPIPEAAHKVGESTVELGSQYLERLGLKDYLHEHHLIKFGLRFFPGGGHLPIEERVEIGPINQPVITSYQIDRGRFESDLRALIEGDGVDLWEGAMVRDIELCPDEQHHEVVIETVSGSSHRATARWVVDATGRAGLLRGRMKLKRGGNHEASAGWFRVRGRVDITKMASPGAGRWHGVPEASQRWLSTNHLMGPGYWVWIIPLSSNTTSIGVVVHEEFHAFDRVRSLGGVQAFLEEYEPALASFLSGAEVLDFRALRRYCHTVSRCWHSDRWAMVGEAGAFTDPLYSPGTDYIALANSFTAELIRVDRESGDLATRVRELNLQYRALVSGSIGVYRNSAEVYGHPRAMATKIYWDNHVYWSFPCQFFQQNIFRLTGEELQPFTVAGARFVELSERIQEVLKFWARNRPADFDETPEGDMWVVPGFPSMLIDAHCALDRRMTADQTLRYMQAQLKLGEELFAEIVIRVLAELGPIDGRRMAEDLGLEAWGLSVRPERLAAEEQSGRSRRRALPTVARDVERALGAPRTRWALNEVAAWLGAPQVEVA